MATVSATVNGWRTRALKRWYPTAGGWVDCSSIIDAVNCVASSPTLNDGSGYSGNMFCTCIKITTPNSSSIGKINSITIGLYANNISNATGPLYGSLRTVDTSYSTDTDTLESYRTYVAGNSEEQSLVIPASGFANYSMTFTGIFEKNTSYYLYLYTKSTDDRYQFHPNDTAYYCEVEYLNGYTVTFLAGDGSGTVPATINGYEGQTVTIGNQIPTPPKNSTVTTTDIIITAYNDTNKFGTHTAAKNEYNTYSFKNWQGNGYTLSAGDTVTLTSNITLTAQYDSTKVTEYANNKLSDVINTVGNPSKEYTPQNITVLLDAETNGGITEVSNLIATKTGEYTFNGWSTEQSSESVLNANTTFIVSTDIYAIYSLTTNTSSVKLPTSGVSKPTDIIDTYTVTLDPNGGTVTPTSISIDKTREYKFLGWSKDPNSTTYITEYTPSTENDKIYAIFDSGTVINNTISLPIPILEDYAFIGWCDSIDGSVYVDTNYIATSDITLFAHYKLAKAIEMYIFSNGAWRRATGYLSALDVLFNKCVNA